MNYCELFAYSVVPVLVIGLVRKYREFIWGRCVLKESLRNKIFVVTGANTGIGAETAKELATHDATVIMACRDLKSAEEAIKNIRRVTTAGKLIPLELELGSFKSIQKFVRNLSQNYSKIDALINNAGLNVPLVFNKRTVEDYEIHFGVNHLGPFLLTNLLLKYQRFAPNARIIMVSSLLAQKGEIVFENLNGELGLSQPRKYANPAYNNSKICNFLFARELTERTKDKDIDVFACCPGFTYTNLGRHYSFKFYEMVFFAPFALIFLRTVNEGAQCVLYCATEPKLKGQSGKFYRNCREFTPSINFDISKRMWDVSMQMCRQHKAID